MSFIVKIRDITRNYEEELSQQEEMQERNTHSTVLQSAPQFLYDDDENMVQQLSE